VQDSVSLETITKMNNLNLVQQMKNLESGNFSNEENKKKSKYDSLTTENSINITYLQTYCQTPAWQIEDYFVV